LTTRRLNEKFRLTLILATKNGIFNTTTDLIINSLTMDMT